MITNEKMAELVEQTGEILRVAFKRGHLPFNEAAILASPVAAVILKELIEQDKQNVKVPFKAVSANPASE